jgi:peptide/nickel transport system substrate-binding protein
LLVRIDAGEPVDDGKTYTFKIRQGIKWHDGSTLSADDVVASWKKIIDPPKNGTLI